MNRLKTLLAAALLLSGITSQPVSANLVLSAPPLGKAAAERQIYEPMAAYLSQVLGETVEYRHANNFGLYQAEMQLGKYDIVFDGPHFSEWRVVKMKHEILAKAPGQLAFVVVVKDSDKDYQSLSDLRGHSICGLAPPNLATQTIFQQFKVAEPHLLLAPSFQAAFKQMLAGKCTAVILAKRMYSKLSQGAPVKSRVVFTSREFPSLTITASNKISATKLAELRKKLVSSEAKAAMPRFVKQYTGGKGLMPANPEDYLGMEQLLKDSWGFGI
jgi:ABC-type phosphate/phosphonate transport system substrate-binding protein